MRVADIDTFAIANPPPGFGGSFRPGFSAPSAAGTRFTGSSFSVAGFGAAGLASGSAFGGSAASTGMRRKKSRKSWTRFWAALRPARR